METEEMKFLKLKDKVVNMCVDEGFRCEFVYSGYPLTMTVKPVTGMADQLSMLENAEDGEGVRYSEDAKIVFEMRDAQITKKMQGKFSISDKFEGKLKNNFKQLCTLYLGFLHRWLMATKALEEIPEPDPFAAAEGT